MVFCESFINEPISMFDNDSTETSPDMIRVKPFRETPFFVNSSAYHSDKSLGYICRGDAAYSVELHDDTLLAGDASDTALDASEVAIGDDDPVTILEMALRAVHKEDVIAVNARQTDKIIHLFVANDKWWILTVSIGFKVVIVVAEIGIVR